MSELNFAQPARRNLLVPVLVAFLILGIALVLVLRNTPRSTADLAILKTSLYPTHTVYKAESLLVGRDNIEDNLYVLTTVRVEDKLKLPLFIKDMTATLVTAEGETIEASAVQKQDLPNLYTSFPALRPLSSSPLLRETLINPGETSVGMVLLRFPVTEEAWKERRSATLNIALYHQGPVSIEIPKDTQTGTNAAR
ncbi:MAG TPA: hypothetical protein VGB69_09165 [Edaphobacter sp.]